MAISVVQTAAGIAGAADFGAATTSGNSIVALTAGYTGSATENNPVISGVALGSTADTFVQWAGKQDTTNYGQLRVWLDSDCTGGQVGVSAATNADLPTANVIVFALEVSGLGAQLDVKNVSAGTSLTSTSWTSGTTSATSAASELAVGFVVVYDTTGTPTIESSPGPPWSEHLAGLQSASVTGKFTSTFGYQVLSSSEALKYNGTQNNGAWMAAVVSFFPSNIPGTGSATGAGSLSAGGHIVGVAAPAGAGVLAKPNITCTFNSQPISGAGAIAETSQQTTQITLTGAGALSAIGGHLGTANLAGAGAVTAVGKINGTASLAGAGNVAANSSVAGITQGIATLAGAGVMLPPVVQEQITDISGATTLATETSTLLITNNPVQGVGNVVAQGSFPGVTNLSGVGAVTAKGESAVAKSISAKFAWSVPILVPVIHAVLEWNTREQLTVSPLLEWRLNQTLILSQDIRFRDLAPGGVVKTQFRWNVGILSVTKSASMAWRALFARPVTAEFAWNLVETTRLFARSTWNVKKAVSVNTLFQWKLKKRVQTVAQFAWREKGRVNTRAFIKWNTHAQVDPSRAIYWHTRKLDTVTAQVYWRLGVTPVNVTATCEWETRGNVFLDANLGWKTVGRPKIGYRMYWNTLIPDYTSATMEWNVSAVPQTAIRQTALNPIFFSYPGT